MNVNSHDTWVNKKSFTTTSEIEESYGEGVRKEKSEVREERREKRRGKTKEGEGKKRKREKKKDQ